MFHVVLFKESGDHEVRADLWDKKMLPLHMSPKVELVLVRIAIEIDRIAIIGSKS